MAKEFLSLQISNWSVQICFAIRKFPRVNVTITFADKVVEVKNLQALSIYRDWGDSLNFHEICFWFAFISASITYNIQMLTFINLGKTICSYLKRFLKHSNWQFIPQTCKQLYFRLMFAQRYFISEMNMEIGWLYIFRINVVFKIATDSRHV